jgi:hypothetical protein
MRLRAEWAEQRIRECAAIMGVPDGGQYLNDWKDAKRAAEAERDRLRELLEKGADLVDVSIDEAILPENATLVAWAAHVRIALEPGRGENEGEREP